MDFVLNLDTEKSKKIILVLLTIIINKNNGIIKEKVIYMAGSGCPVF